MATIPRSYLDALTESLNTLSQGTQLAASKQLEAINYTDIADLREKAIAILTPLLVAATEAAAAYSATAYDAIREYSIGEALGAVAYSGYTPEATEGAVRALVGRVDTLGYESFKGAIDDRCDYEIKRAAGESIAYNSERDPKSEGYARVPQGSETCGFCLMLASFGVKYGDKDKVKHAHPNCDCRIVPWYEGMSIDGYDPDKMYENFNKCLDTIGGRDGIRADWNALSAEERNAYIAKHGGKEGKAFDAYVNKRIAAEIETRDADWFRTGKEPEITYASKELETIIKKKRPHEVETANRLSAIGIPCGFRVDERRWTDIATRQERSVGLADLDNGIELKSLINAKSLGAVDSALRDAGHKEDLRMCVIDNSWGKLDDVEVLEVIRRKMHRRRINDCILITSDGKPLRI